MHGLAAAKTYLQVRPSAKIIIFEAASTIGGTWAENRLYPSLKSNNVLGMYEYSDYPMDTATYGVKPEEHIPGKVMHRYLKNYAEHFGFYNKIRFNSKVESAEHLNSGGWSINTVQTSRSSASNHESQLFTSKLIVATGLTSNPFIPEINGSGSFEAPIFHSKDLLKYTSTQETMKGITVLGCTKSGWDAVYAYASKGVTVNWISK